MSRVVWTASRVNRIIKTTNWTQPTCAASVNASIRFFKFLYRTCVFIIVVLSYVLFNWEIKYWLIDWLIALFDLFLPIIITYFYSNTAFISIGYSSTVLGTAVVLMLIFFGLLHDLLSRSYLYHCAKIILLYIIFYHCVRSWVNNGSSSIANNRRLTTVTITFVFMSSRVCLHGPMPGPFHLS